MDEVSAYMVCMECGESFGSRTKYEADMTTRRELERHWQAFGRGPDVVQSDAIDRAKASIGRADDQQTDFGFVIDGTGVSPNPALSTGLFRAIVTDARCGRCGLATSEHRGNPKTGDFGFLCPECGAKWKTDPRKLRPLP